MANPNPSPSAEAVWSETSETVKNPAREPRTEPIKEKVVKVYVWELPVRIFHWVNAICILLLMVTGLYIGKPFFSASIPEDAYYSFVMGWARYIHFFAAFLFTVTLLFRLYWVFKGNKYAISNPLRKIFWVELWETIKFYLLLKHRKPEYVGHNPLAQLSYWIFIGLGSIIMIFTGFYLYFEPQPESLFGSFFFSWVPVLFGGDSYTIRSLHHLVAWAFIVFMVIHIYLAIREDYLSKNGTLSSIFTGYKTVPEETVGDKDEQ